MTHIPSQFPHLPWFCKIEAREIEPTLTKILSENRRALKQILAKTTHPTWQTLMQPLEAIDDRLGQMWAIVEHLHSVDSHEALREAYKRCLPKLTKYHTEISQNKLLYHRILTLSKNKQLTPTQKKIIKDALLNFSLSGVDLPAKKKQQLTTLRKKLSQLTTMFEEHVLDATHAWYYTTTSKKELSGLPDYIIDGAKHSAKAYKKKGWVLTLDFHVYYAVLTYANNRKLRETFYNAYTTRASDQGPTAGKFDNSKLIDEILKIRFDIAKIVGFKNYADYSLATKMASSSKEVLHFLELLAKKSKPVAQKELKQLEHFTAKEYKLKKLEAWDITYYSDKLRTKLFDISPGEVRNYFQEDRVLQGLFELTQKLYNVAIIERFDVCSWNDDVRYFEIFDKTNTLRGTFYMDLYARSNKRGGAWMAEYRNRRLHDNGHIQVPIAFLNCNFNKPVKGKPSLLTHQEVITLFHEFGHTLHHLLTQVNEADAAGINGVPWDAVELPSQFMENFAWEKSVIDKITKHYRTGKKMPDALYKKLIKSKNFQSGMQMMRQLLFALFDFTLHQHKEPNVQKILDDLRKQYSVVPTPKYNRFQNSFTHIFSGGYAAGYYSYKWAEVLSCDAFDLFLKEGIFNPKVTESFLKNILEVGGSRDMNISFKKFRGRKPNIQPLLKSSGIIS